MGNKLNKLRTVFTTLVLLLLLAGRIQAADVRWIGAAQEQPQIQTIQATGVWATGDTASITCNKKTLTATLGSDVSVNDVVEILSRMINASNATENLKTDETRNFGGQEFGEFKTDIVATYAGDTLTLTSKKHSDGSYWPFTVTRSESTAGTGALGAIATSQAHTGPHNFDNVDNWEGGSLLSAGDEAVLDFNNSDMLFGLSNTTENISLTVKNAYKKNIGLKKMNTEGSLPYPEYRQRFLVLPLTATTGNSTATIGEDVAESTQGRRYIDFGTNTSQLINLRVKNAGPRTDDGASVQVVGGTRVFSYVHGGSVDLGTNVGENSTEVAKVETITGQGSVTPDIRVGSNTTYFLPGSAVQLVELRSGTISIASSPSDSNLKLNVYGGKLVIESSSVINIVNLYGGLVDFRGIQVASININRGIFDASGAKSANLSGTLTMYRGAEYRDPQDVLSAAVVLSGCSIDEVTLDLKPGVSP